MTNAFEALAAPSVDGSFQTSVCQNPVSSLPAANCPCICSGCQKPSPSLHHVHAEFWEHLPIGVHERLMDSVKDGKYCKACKMSINRGHLPVSLRYPEVEAEIPGCPGCCEMSGPLHRMNVPTWQRLPSAVFGQLTRSVTGDLYCHHA